MSPLKVLTIFDDFHGFINVDPAYKAWLVEAQ